MNVFDKYIEEGLGKLNSFNRKLETLRDLLINLSESLKRLNVELDWLDLNDSRGIGYQTIISVNGFHKNFISITIDSSNEDTYFLEYNKEITVSKSIGSLSTNIGRIISSSSFWREIDKFRSVNFQ